MQATLEKKNRKFVKLVFLGQTIQDSQKEL
jgi:hypothetical protein